MPNIDSRTLTPDPLFMLTRRHFLKSTAAGVLLGPAGNWALAAGEAADDWSFPLLGDLHFDRLEHHDHEWLAREHPGDVAQVQNYSRITRDMTPRLFERVRESLAAAQTKSKTHVPFVLQLGDLLEGLCGNEQLAANSRPRWNRLCPRRPIFRPARHDQGQSRHHRPRRGRSLPSDAITLHVGSTGTNHRLLHANKAAHSSPSTTPTTKTASIGLQKRSPHQSPRA